MLDIALCTTVNLLDYDLAADSTASCPLWTKFVSLAKLESPLHVTNDHTDTSLKLRNASARNSSRGGKQLNVSQNHRRYVKAK